MPAERHRRHRSRENPRASRVRSVSVDVGGVAQAADQDVHALNGTEGYPAERGGTAEKREVTGSTPVPATTKVHVNGLAEC